MYLLFIAGLLTGFHCLTMCGNFVIGYSLRSDRKLTLLNHVLYNSARLTSYVFTGIVLGFAGKTLNIKSIAPFATIAGAIFLLFISLKLFGVKTSFSIANLPGIRSFYQLISKKAVQIRKSKDTKFLDPEIALGLLSGFMPCTPLQAAQLYAAGTASPLQGGLSMLSFGLGTIPMLFLYGIFAGKLSLNFREKMQKVSAAVIFILALVLLNRGLILINSPVTASKIVGLAKESFEGSSAASNVETVKIEITNTTYVPSEIRIPENKPVKLVVKRNEDNICSAQLVIPEIGLRKDLIPFGTTVIELPPLKKGIYQLTCQMGMMDGRLIVGNVSYDAKIKFGVLLFFTGVMLTLYALLKNKKMEVS